MIKTMKSTTGLAFISKSMTIFLFKSGRGIIQIFCAKLSSEYLKSFPDQAYWLDVLTPSGDSTTRNKSPKVGHILEDGEELIISVKNDRIFYNIPKGWKLINSQK